MDVFEALGAATGRGRRAVLVTVIAVSGQAPSHPGAKLVVCDGAVLAGTLGCSEFDAAGVELAGVLTGPAAGPGEDGADGADGAIGAGAGGAGTGVAGAAGPGPVTLQRRVVFGHGEERVLELFAERYDPRPAVTVIGDTPVGRALAAMAELLGRRVTVLSGDPAGSLRAAPPGVADAVVVTDHDAPWVDDVLALALPSDAFFVGMMGSRRHAPAVVARLRDAGLPAAALGRLRSPCGLDIGSRTPAEIALSMLAEIVAAERGRDGGRLASVAQPAQ